MQTTVMARPGASITRLPSPQIQTDMHDYLRRLVEKLNFQKDERHRYMVVAHLFDDTMRMIEALEPFVGVDSIIGLPYSSNRPGLVERWTARFGNRVHVRPSVADMERLLVDELARSLANCRKRGQRLIVQETSGFVTPILHKYFGDQLHLVKGIVEITKQGVWRAEALDLAVPVLHCADSEMKRFEARRCGETIARCLDGIARDLGLSLAGRIATVMGAGWIGTGIASALRRLDMVPALVDTNPLRVAEARLEGYLAARTPDWIEASHLVVGATGRTSITRELLERMPNNAIVASGSSRQLEIDVDWLHGHARSGVTEAVEAFHLDSHDPLGRARTVLLVNDGFPANFIAGSGSVPDEIVETILGELIVLMHALARDTFAPGIHRISQAQECLCAELWLELRDAATPRVCFRNEARLPVEDGNAARRIAE